MRSKIILGLFAAFLAFAAVMTQKSIRDYYGSFPAVEVGFTEAREFETTAGGVVTYDNVLPKEVILRDEEYGADYIYVVTRRGDELGGAAFILSKKYVIPYDAEEYVILYYEDLITAPIVWSGGEKLYDGERVNIR